MKPTKQSKKPVKSGTKNTRIEPALPSGFRDYGPGEQAAREQMIETIRSTFRSFGFEPISTPAVERTDVLIGGEQGSDNIMYRVQPAQRGEIIGKERRDENSLRFDLTVPFARFLAANQELPKPFKRYQIGSVWRGERPQQGRYREFMQADIDIVGTDIMEADAEVIFAMYTTLKNLGIEYFVIKINNRAILNALPAYAGFPEKKLPTVLRILDKKDKIGEGAMYKEIEKECEKESIAAIKKFFKSPDVFQKLDGWQQLDEIQQNLSLMGMDKKYREVDLSIVRGLGYYTGPIFETVLTNLPEIGSVFSGGRYDNLVTRFTGQNIPAVGASLGVDRLFAAMQKLSLFEDMSSPVDALIFNLSQDFLKTYYEFARMLRDMGIAVSLYLGEDKSFSSQLAYAVKKQIPFAVIYGENEQKKNMVTIKNMIERTQKEVPMNEFAAFIKERLRS